MTVHWRIVDLIQHGLGGGTDEELAKPGHLNDVVVWSQDPRAFLTWSMLIASERRIIR